MQDLIKQEQFEIEVLDKLNSAKLLQPLIFGGGTMLRLCYKLNRYSVDLDFWFIKEVDLKVYFKKCLDFLKKDYVIKDSANKYYTLLVEIRSKNFPRSLKIEMRKEIKSIKSEEAIAYSSYSNNQVFVKTVPLKNMMESKIQALLDRKEIRDCFDIEFLLKKGIDLNVPLEQLKQLLVVINSFDKKDYTLKLNSLLPQKERKYYYDNKFKILQMDIQEKLDNYKRNS